MKIPSISTDMVRILLGGLPLEQGELDEILRQSGIDFSLLSRSQKRIPVSQLAMMWTLMEQASGDPNMGLHMGELHDGIPQGHVLFSVLLNSHTLGQALERYCRYHDIMGDFVQPTLVKDGDKTLLTLSRPTQVTFHRQHVDYIFSLLVSILTSLSNAPFKGEVRFAFPSPTHIDEYHRIFGNAVHFAKPENELVFGREYLASSIPATDAELLGILEGYAKRLLRRIRPEKAWSAKVSELLSRTLNEGKPSISQVARLLAVSTRKLQGKLKAEGTTYQEVLDTTRHQLAAAYLDDDKLTLVDIAFLLGFADQSAFNHAFRKWTGKSPMGFRESRRQA